MSDLIPDQTIVQARLLDFWPIQAKGRAALPPCLDLLYGSGHLRLTYAQIGLGVGDARVNPDRRS